ncbi:MAG: phosphatase PAP2 family protein [Patescibacteria group bacterium]
MNLDIYFFTGINNFVGKSLWLDTLGIFLAQYFEYILIFILFLFLFKNFKRYSKMIGESFFAAILAKEIFVDIIRQLIPRVRPFINGFKLLIYHPVTAAFPSAHAAVYFAIATIVYLHNKKAGSVFLFCASLIAIARVYVGVHWPSDIVVGALIGTFSAIVVNRISKEFKK